jgi:hypothetical protein
MSLIVNVVPSVTDGSIYVSNLPLGVVFWKYHEPEPV